MKTKQGNSKTFSNPEAAGRDRKRQQTVPHALDNKTSRIIESKGLLSMSEETLHALRRDAWSDKAEMKQVEKRYRLTCSLCNAPLSISRQNIDGGNRWFKHRSDSSEVIPCLFRSDHSYSPDELFALKYHGQQEGPEHKYLKHFIADWLEREPNGGEVHRDKVYITKHPILEWKRPDVRYVVGERRIVFEIQLSYTFISEVVRRDAFYQRDRTHIIWVFRKFQPDRQMLRDEIFFNKRNVFVLDEDAERETIRRQRLTFKCYYQTSRIVDNSIHEEWTWRYVNLDGIEYPTPQYRPYYWNFDLARESLLKLNFIRKVLTYCRVLKQSNDREAIPFRKSAISAWALLTNTLNFIPPGEFFASTFVVDILPKILSIKMNKPIGYRMKRLWEVLNSAFNISWDGPHPFNILYLMAIECFEPDLRDDQEQVSNIRERIIQSITNGEEKFIRDTTYDSALALLFPDLATNLKSTYATRKERQGGLFD